MGSHLPGNCPQGRQRPPRISSRSGWGDLCIPPNMDLVRQLMEMLTEPKF